MEVKTSESEQQVLPHTQLEDMLSPNSARLRANLWQETDIHLAAFSQPEHLLTSLANHSLINSAQPHT